MVVCESVEASIEMSRPHDTIYTYQFNLDRTFDSNEHNIRIHMGNYMFSIFINII